MTDPPTTDDRRPTTDDRRPTTDDRRPTTDDRRPTADDRSPTAQPPTAQPRLILDRLLGLLYGLTRERKRDERVVGSNRS